ncbi:MerR family transcriptional regulator [Dictyobacter formicarum]|uniref:MerR family transcriptional regulator n=1 Tax=Dictyobacter formicarum TaxID=2778368 RepID=UPI0022A7A33F|nr:MerR family transcriptional regulator [Dictyobacter formicarum]
MNLQASGKERQTHGRTFYRGSEVARRAGVRTSTLRYYESMGLLSAPQRISGGHRRYDPSVLKRLKVLQMAQRAGWSIADMRLLVAGFSPDTPSKRTLETTGTKKDDGSR